MKRPELLGPISNGLVAGSAHRQIARSLGCAPSTVTRLAARIGRHALLFQTAALGLLNDLGEAVVLDPFETFVHSQDDRLAIATAVGQRSWFTYAIEGASHRRAGRRSVLKRSPRGTLPVRLPGALARAIENVLERLDSLASGDLTLITDDDPTFAALLRRRRSGRRIIHRAYRNPQRGPGSDRDTIRERDRAMFPVDLLHKIWRHTQAHHRRETIAFGRRSNAVLERAAIFIVWRNFIKHVSERKPTRETPATRLGIVERPLRWRDILARRLFPRRIGLSESWSRIYFRRWITPAVGRNLPHALKHAV